MPPTLHHRTLRLAHDLPLDSGQLLPRPAVAYETLGTLNADRSNAILVCHAWTGDSHAAGAARQQLATLLETRPRLLRCEKPALLDLRQSRQMGQHGVAVG